MKPRFAFIAIAVLLALVIAACVMPSGADAAPQKPAAQTARRSVLDYFRLLPARYFEFANRRVLLEKSYLPVIDLKNDYLQVGGDAAQPALEVTVFRGRGLDLIAVSASYEIGYDFALLRYEKGRWKNVTADLSPLANSANLRFQLPRYATTIKVFKGNGQLLMKMKWRNGRFETESSRPKR